MVQITHRPSLEKISRLTINEMVVSKTALQVHSFHAVFAFSPHFVSAKESACNASWEYITNLIKGLRTALLKTQDWVMSVYITPEVSFQTLMHFRST